MSDFEKIKLVSLRVYENECVGKLTPVEAVGVALGLIDCIVGGIPDYESRQLLLKSIRGAIETTCDTSEASKNTGTLN